MCHTDYVHDLTRPFHCTPLVPRSTRTNQNVPLYTPCTLQTQKPGRSMQTPLVPYIYEITRLFHCTPLGPTRHQLTRLFHCTPLGTKLFHCTHIGTKLFHCTPLFPTGHTNRAVPLYTPWPHTTHTNQAVPLYTTWRHTTQTNQAVSLYTPCVPHRHELTKPFHCIPFVPYRH